MNQLYDPNESWAATIARCGERQVDRWWERPCENRWFKRAVKACWRRILRGEGHTSSIAQEIEQHLRDTLGISPTRPWGRAKPECDTSRYWQEKPLFVYRSNDGQMEARPFTLSDWPPVLLSRWVSEKSGIACNKHLCRWHRGLDPNRLPD